MGLKRQAISGTIWTGGSSVVMALIQILRLSILTRFLEKSDFGLVAIVVLVLGFTHIFSDLGVSVSLFSKEEISKNEYSSLYWVSIILAILLYLGLLIITPLIASFYNQTELISLIPIMGLDLIFSTIGRQFRIFRQKALSFRNLAIIDISAAILSLVVAVVVAIKGGGIWSIVYSTLFASLFTSICLILTGLSSHPLSFHVNLKEGKSFYKIGFYQTGSQIFDYLASQLDILIIGKIMDTSSLGVYNLVKQLASRVYTVINPIITGVAVPVLATLQEQLGELKVRYLQMLNIVSFINVGVYGVLAVLSREVLLIIYGKEYMDASIVFQILCLWGAFSAVNSVSSTIVIIKGRTDLGFQWTIIRILANPIFVIVGSFWGLNGIVIGQAIYSFLSFGIYWKFLIRRILNNISFREYIITTLPKFLLGFFVFLLLFTVKYLFVDNMSNAVLNITLFSLAFSMLYLFFNRDELVIFVKMLKKEKTLF